ncbi:MAG: hypothetical protein JST15_09475 [Bacteroidetes bacterium]|nr:hypothetical protein [Bacteroidota bacterium]
MKNSFFIIFFAVIISIVSSQNILSQVIDSFSSQDSSAKRKTDINSLKKGFYSIQFAINSNFTLGNFDDATLSIKRHLSSHSALRLSFSGNYVLQENDNNDFLKESEAYYSVNLIYIYYLNPLDIFNVYGFTGCNYSFGNSLREYTNGYSKSKYLSYGPLVGIGTEYFIFRKLSLFAEYSYSFNFGKTTTTSDNYSDPFEKSESSSSTINFHSENVKFGLAVYFSF